MSRSAAVEQAKATRRARKHAATRAEIKDMARAHMARDGAAALSLRAVAAEMELSSAALYYYYPNRDALITDLIIDAFEALGAAMLEAGADAGADIAARLTAAMAAYRTWALAHPAEFALIYGTPIPGYQAPAERTAPAARRAMAVLGGLFQIAWEQSRLHVPTAEGPLPARLVGHAADWSARAGQPVAIAVLHATLRAWALGHGLVSLELYQHLQPLIGDPHDLFGHELRALLIQLGVLTAAAG